MWRLPNDYSQSVITASEQILSSRNECWLHLPETAVVFFMSKGTDYLIEHYETEEMPELLPRFLNRCPVWTIPKLNLCFLDGGRGAPQAVDTLETLHALGVKNIIAVGMCGAYTENVVTGEIIAPQKAFVEEGTSLHYYESVEVSYPDDDLLNMTLSFSCIHHYPIVSMDAVYRQTFSKEQLWREKGAVCVDMETSAVFSVAKYLGVKAVALLMVSDLAPLNPDAPKWKWQMTEDMREQLAEQAIALAQKLIE